MTSLRVYARVLAFLCAAFWLVQPALAADPQDAALAHIEKLREQGKLQEAFAAYDAAIADAERQFGPVSARVSKLAHDAAIFAMLLGHYTDAEVRARKALAVEAKLNGPKHGNTAAILNTLSQILIHQGRYQDAIGTARNGVTVAEGAFGKDHPNVGATLESLGNAEAENGLDAQAEATFRQAIAIEEKALGANHPAVASALIALAGVAERQMRLTEAETLLKRVVAIAAKSYGENHPNNATALSRLASNYMDQGRWDDAKGLLTRALAIRQKVLGMGHAEVADTLNDLAWTEMGRGNAAAAETQFRAALLIRERAAGTRPADIARNLANLARSLRLQGKHADAERQLRRAATWIERAGETNKAWTAPIPTSLARALLAQNKAAEAEAEATRATTLVKDNNLSKASAFHALASAQLAQNKAASALANSRTAAAIIAERKTEAVLADIRGDARAAIDDREIFVLPVRAAFAAARANAKQEAALRAESFEFAQRSGAAVTARALWRMAARFAARNDALAKLLREQQTLTLRLPEIEAQYASLLAAEDAATRMRADERRAASDKMRARLKQLDETLRKDARFAEYAELADPKPVSVAEMQALLKPNEAAVHYLVGETETFVFAISKENVAWAKLNATAASLATEVAALRQQLDPTLWQVMPPRIAPFDRARAYRLHQDIWAPVANVVNGKANVFVVADGALSSLPFGVLVAAPPQGADNEPQALRDTAWLIKRHALVTLPSLSSLKALRKYASRTGGSEPFSGFGDPTLSDPNDIKGARAKRKPVAAFFRGAAPDLAQLAELSSLPATADELKSLATAAGGNPATDLWLRERATETEIKTHDFSRKRVVAFSTHGLLAGELGQGEPGLVLTLPKKATPRDDGFLAASEIAELNLGADWVILSACNTASGEKPGAEGLSGLARAFFFSGAKALLVSHWPVWEDTSAALTTGALANAKNADRPQALRQSMLSVMNDKREARFAHPAAWAPFVLVGD